MIRSIMQLQLKASHIQNSIQNYITFWKHNGSIPSKLQLIAHTKRYRITQTRVI